MRCCAGLAILALVLGTSIGCGGSGDAGGDAQGSGPAAGTSASQGNGAEAPTVLTGTESPAAAVATFLEAVRTGADSTVAEQLLTELARTETAKLDLAVAPTGSDNARFEIGEVTQLSDDAARVASTWTDLNDDGTPHTDDILWMLRRTPEGWRIAGMAATLFPGEPPLILNFEDSADMARTQQLAQEEIARRMQAEASAAQAPASSQEGTIQR